MTHGSRSTYINHGCRCAPCRAANCAYIVAARARRSQSIPADRHGRVTTYWNYSCRCSLCRDANAARARDLRANKKAAILTHENAGSPDSARPVDRTGGST